VPKTTNNRSAIDILAEIGKTPEEIRQLMREAAESMAAWCQTSHVSPVTARSRIHDAAMNVLKGRRYSGARPKRAADKIVSKLMKTYEWEYRQWAAEARRSDEARGANEEPRHIRRLKKKWAKRRTRGR